MLNEVRPALPMELKPPPFICSSQNRTAPVCPESETVAEDPSHIGVADVAAVPPTDGVLTLMVAIELNSDGQGEF